jgi:hypothetical protein
MPVARRRASSARCGFCARPCPRQGVRVTIGNRDRTGTSACPRRPCERQQPCEPPAERGKPHQVRTASRPCRRRRRRRRGTGAERVRRPVCPQDPREGRARSFASRGRAECRGSVFATGDADRACSPARSIGPCSSLRRGGPGPGRAAAQHSVWLRVRVRRALRGQAGAASRARGAPEPSGPGSARARRQGCRHRRLAPRCLAGRRCVERLRPAGARPRLVHVTRRRRLRASARGCPPQSWAARLPVSARRGVPSCGAATLGPCCRVTYTVCWILKPAPAHEVDRGFGRTLTPSDRLDHRR